VGKVAVVTNLTLDGMMQAPGRPDEDRRGDFEHGGWATPYAAMQHLGGSMADAGGLLLGRRKYEDLYAVWPQRKDNPHGGVEQHAEVRCVEDAEGAALGVVIATYQPTEPTLGTPT
jgi:hypothetical protein